MPFAELCAECMIYSRNQKAIMATALNSKNDFDTSDRKPNSRIVKQRFVTMHNKELQGRSSNVITDPVFVHLSVPPAPEYGLLSPWSQYGCNHSRHYIHSINIQRWMGKSGSSLYFFLRTKKPFPEDSTTKNSHWSDLYQIPTQKPVTDERNSPALCDCQWSVCVTRSGFMLATTKEKWLSGGNHVKDQGTMVYDETGEIEVHLALKSFKPLNRRWAWKRYVFFFFFF